MTQIGISPDALKRAIKEALVEALGEERDFFREVFAEVLEDFALVEAIEEGRQTELVDRDRIFELLEDSA